MEYHLYRKGIINVPYTYYYDVWEVFDVKKGNITIRQVMDAHNRILEQGGIKPTHVNMTDKNKDRHWMKFENYCKRHGIDIGKLDWYL